MKNIALEIVELYPYVEYMKYLLSGSIALAMYISVMIGGGMLYIDDKARGCARGLSGNADHQAGTGDGAECGGGDQGAACGHFDYGHWVTDGGAWEHLPSGADLQSAFC